MKSVSFLLQGSSKFDSLHGGTSLTALENVRGLSSVDVFAPNQYPRKPITTFQAPSIDRLHGHPGLPFGDHDSQIAVTLGTGALEVLGHAGLLNHVGDVNLGIHDFAEFAPSTRLCISVRVV